MATALVALLLAALAPVAGHPESAAPTLRSDVLAAGHEPATVAPHTQWSGWLRVAPDSNVTAASYQICRVGAACFAPPAPAIRAGDTFRFDTANYTVAGHAVDYQGGWRVGVVWFLTEGVGEDARVVAFPDGPSASDPACAGESQALACQEAHYLAFDVAGEARSTPMPPLPAVMGMLGVALAVALRRRDG